MRSKLVGNGEGWGEKWKGIKRTGVRGKQAAEAQPEPERAAMQLALSKLTCNLSIFFLDSHNHHQVLKRERRNYPGKPVQTSIIISSVPTAFFWRILSSVSELEHKRDAFVFRLAGKKGTLRAFWGEKETGWRTLECICASNQRDSKTFQHPGEE